MTRVLIVDDDAGVAWALRSVVEGAGHEVETAPTAARALARVREAAFDLVLLDVRLPDADGLDVLRTLREERPEVPVVVITAHGGLETTVRAVQGGAAEFLVKPLAVGEVRAVVERVLAERRACAAKPEASVGAAAAAKEPLLVGRSPAMLEVYKQVAVVSGSDLPVLLLGESGTGKEVVARAIHQASARKNAPFEPIDCAAIPAELFESELYGHRAGAFTGAVRERVGRVRRADGGTVFLDEVGELPLAAQGKLLRFLAERDVVPVGGDARIPVDVRVIAATNRSLEEAVGRGEFREDLFYRLHVFEIALPPLRERRPDLRPLVEHFARRRGHDAGVADEVWALWKRYDWPGNVRELRNVVEHAAALARGQTIQPRFLPPRFGRSPAPGGGKEELRAAAERLLDEAIAAGSSPHAYAIARLDRALFEVARARSGHNLSAIARLLDLSRVTVRKRLRSIDLAGGEAPD